MFEHWLHCHAIYQRDKKHLKHVYELRYEDYVENQAKYHEEIAAFLVPPFQNRLTKMIFECDSVACPIRLARS